MLAVDPERAVFAVRRGAALLIAPGDTALSAGLRAAAFVAAWRPTVAICAMGARRAGIEPLASRRRFAFVAVRPTFAPLKTLASVGGDRLAASLCARAAFKRTALKWPARAAIAFLAINALMIASFVATTFSSGVVLSAAIGPAIVAPAPLKRRPALARARFLLKARPVP
ncbi:MAG: hypothetical protein K2Q06_08610 [Parvularculaceae bacterium]|nr:hypothetical protein [Parvularculaceae bacterium]